jgi:predicted nucleic acid-binding protein
VRLGLWRYCWDALSMMNLNAALCNRSIVNSASRDHRRVQINDLWIAAIAASRALPVVTQDDDCAGLDGAANLTIIRV